MSLSLANIKTRVKTKIRAEMGTPALNDLHDTSITQWANDNTANVIRILGMVHDQKTKQVTIDTSHFPTLLVVDNSLTFSSGYASLPSDYVLAKAVKVTTTSPAVTKKYCRLFFDANEFARWDSSNFIYTPDQERPIALAGDKIYIKPSTLTAGYLDYVQSHPTISGSQDTVFDPVGDEVLIRLILADYYRFIEEESLELNSLKMAGAI